MPEPANLRFLRRLVTVLTGVMILGLLTLIVLFVMRFSALPAPLALPENLQLPDGLRAEAVTYTPRRILVVVEGERLLVFSREGQLQQEIPLGAP